MWDTMYEWCWGNIRLFAFFLHTYCAVKTIFFFALSHSKLLFWITHQKQAYTTMKTNRTRLCLKHNTENIDSMKIRATERKMARFIYGLYRHCKPTTIYRRMHIIYMRCVCLCKFYWRKFCRMNRKTSVWKKNNGTIRKFWATRVLNTILRCDWIQSWQLRVSLCSWFFFLLKQVDWKFAVNLKYFQS